MLTNRSWTPWRYVFIALFWFSVVTVLWYVVLTHWLKYDITKTAPISSTYDPSVVPLSFSFFNIFVSAYTITTIVLLGYGIDAYRRTTQGYSLLLDKYCKLADSVKHSARENPELAAYIKTLPHKFLKLMIKMNTETIQTILPLTVDEPWVTLDQKGYNIIRFSCRKHPRLQENINAWMAISNEMSVLKAINAVPAPRALFKLYTLSLLVTYTCVVPFFWSWYSWVWGTVYLGLSIILIVATIGAAYGTGSIFDPATINHGACAEQTDSCVEQINKTLSSRYHD